MVQNKKRFTPEDIHKAFQAAAPFLNIVYVLLGGILFFGYIGHYLDSKIKTSPLLLIFGVFLGFGLGLYNMVKVLKQYDRQ